MINLYALKLPTSPVPPEILESLASHLTDVSREKLKRWRLAEDALRSLAGQLIPVWYLHHESLVTPNQTIAFGKGKRGKPLLSEPVLDPPIEYNTSHDGDYVLFGAVRGKDSMIGVDVMRLPEKPEEIEEALHDQLTIRERQQLLARLSKEERSKLLTVLWTVKEGYTKAIGEGIGFGLERIFVSEMGKAEGMVEFEVDNLDMRNVGWRCQVGFMDGHGWAVIWKSEDEGVEVINVEWEEFVAFFKSLKLVSN